MAEWGYNDEAPKITGTCHLCGQMKSVLASRTTCELRAILCPVCDVLPVRMMIQNSRLDAGNG